MRLRYLAGGLSAAVLAAAMGCGSSDKTTPTPSPIAQQAAEWKAATEKAATIAADMTRDEMLQLVMGQLQDASTDKHLSAGYVPALRVSKTGFVIPAQYLCDGPNGVGNFNQSVTRFPTAISVAASFDVDLARAFGEALGNEWFEKGCTHGLGPGVNIVRLPQGGRTAEYYSEDPYLASRIAVSEVQGIQGQHVIATVKHFAANNQETERKGGNSSLSERTLREIYLPAFEAAAREAGAGALMCSYNRINGTQACENAHVQNEIARDTWGFSGLIMSDWGANFGKTPETAPGFALNGLDLDMPGEQNGMAAYTPANLAGVSGDQLRLMCTRILAALFKVGILHADGSVVAAEVTDVTKNVSTAAHKRLAEQIAAAGTVLLKNVGNVLPLDGADPNLKIAVIGGAAGADSQTALAGGSGSILSSENPISLLDGIEARKVAGTVTYARGAPGGAGSLGNLSVHSTSGAATNDGFAVTFATAEGAPLYNDAHGGGFPVLSVLGTLPNQLCVPYNGVYYCTGGNAYLADGTNVSLSTGAVNWKASYRGFLTVPADGSYEFDLVASSTASLRIDGVSYAKVDSSLLVETNDVQVALTAGEHEVEITLDTSGYQWASASSSSGSGGFTLLGSGPSVSVQYDGGTGLIAEAVTAAADADVAIVVVSDAELEGKDHSVYLPGAQNELIERVAAVAKKTVVVVNAGSGLVLPWADTVDAIVDVWYGGQRLGTATAAVLFGDVNPSGRSVVTFPASLEQWYAQQPSQFPGVKARAADAFRTVNYDEGVFVGYRWFDQQKLTPLFPFGHGLSYTTFAYSGLSLSSQSGKGKTTVTVTIANTGKRDGAEVAQLYVGFPDWVGEPPWQLKAFQKVSLAAGASATASFELDERAFAYWDDATGAWVMPVGDFKVYVGSSSRDVRAIGTYTVTP